MDCRPTVRRSQVSRLGQTPPEPGYRNRHERRTTMLSRNDYDRLALILVATDRSLASNLARVAEKSKPVRPNLVLLAASLRDSLRATTTTRDEEAAARLLEQAAKDYRERRAVSRSRTRKPKES